MGQRTTMTKRTLLFPSLRAAALFSKQADCRFLINTCNLTITGQLTDEEIETAMTSFGAELLENTDCAYSYDPVTAVHLDN